MGRPRPLRPVRHALETAALATLIAVARRLPLERAGDLGAFLGDAARRLLSKRRRIAEQNLREALGLDEAAARHLARDVFRQIGRTMVEFLALPAHSWEELEGRVRFDEGIERLEKHARAGKAALLVTAHYGNWELLGALLGRHVGGLAYVFPAQSNRGADARINDTRRRLGIDLIPMEGGLRGAMRRLLHGRSVGLLCDQDARSIGIHVPFFGRPASTLTGPARLAIRSGCPIYFTLIDRDGPATFRARMLAWLEPDTGADEESEVRRLTIAMTETLERVIRERPDHWYWIHRRWKTPPPAEPPAAAAPPPAAAAPPPARTS